MSGFDHTEHDRLISDIICLGMIEAVDHRTKHLKVRGKTLSTWLPWPAEIGRNYRRWRPLRAGQQVILGSPSGDLGQAVIIGMLYTQALDAPCEDPDVDLVQFENGASIRHNITTGALDINCNGDLTLDVTGTLRLKASTHVIEGPVTQTGGDMTSESISAQHHTHPESVGVVTGEPQ